MINQTNCAGNNIQDSNSNDDIDYTANITYVEYTLSLRTTFNEGITLSTLYYTPCPEKKRTNSMLGITSSNTDRFTKCFHFYNLLEICNKAVAKYPIAPKTRHYTTLWNINVRKTIVSWALWQSCWKINSPELWRVADNSCILKWNLFIITSFTTHCINFR